MTPDDRAHQQSLYATICPDAEVLSCFVDGELPGEGAATVQTHVWQCQECAGVVADMQSLSDHAWVDTASGACPSRETLTGYLLGGLGAPDQAAVDAHALTCDACVHALVKTHRQLQRSWTLDAPIPLALVERASAAARPGADRSASRWRNRRQPPARVPVYLRLPLLMPMAFAAGVAFFVVVNAANLVPHAHVDQTRAASLSTGKRRVTTSEALVRSEPRDTATLVTRVARGMAVEVQAEDREWLLVSLPTGEHGWMPLRAFE